MNVRRFRRKLSKFIGGCTTFLVVVVVAWLVLSGRFSEDEAGSAGRGIYYGMRRFVSDIFNPPHPIRNPRAAAQCRQNLTRIEAAKRSAADRLDQATGTVPYDALVKALGGPIPTCPAGGAINVGALVQLPSCSLGNQGNLGPADDHLIKKY